MSLIPHPKKRFFTILLRAVRILLFVYLLIVGGSYLFLDKLMFHPPVDRSSEPFKKELFTLEARTNQISCLHLKSPGATRTLLYSHGNAEDIWSRSWILSRYATNGLSVLAYDYPGYGQSTGSPTEEGVYQAAESAYRYLTEQCHLRPEEILIYGRSIGSGPSHYLAEKYPVGGLIIECGFTSITRVVTRLKIIPFDAFPNINRIEHIHCPVLFFHGEADETVPFSHGKQMFARAHAPKYKLWIPGCDHANIPQIAGEQYWETLKEFVKNLDSKNQ